MPIPSAVEALEKKSEIILEEYIFKLRQEVGDDFFNEIDASLSKKNRISHPLPASDPEVQQTPAVQP